MRGLGSATSYGDLMSVVVVVGVDKQSIRWSGAQDIAAMSAIDSRRARNRAGELRRPGIAQQQSSLGTGKPEADSDMRRSSKALLMVEREWVAGA